MQDNLDFIKEILGSSPSDSDDGATEFVFGEEPVESGLVFDDADEKPAAEIEEKPVPEKEEKAVEFSVPEEFTVDEKFDVPTVSEGSTPKFYAPYVPRFTEASLNYKMADESSRRESDIAPHAFESHDAATEEFEGDIDSTIESSEAMNQSVTTVNVGGAKDEPLESASTVFKFGENEPPEASVIKAEPVMEENVSEETVKETAEPESDEPREYTIPDPVEESKEIAKYTAPVALASKSRIEKAPDGIGDTEALPAIRKKEYSSFAQRDSHKDNFLDAIMSVKVRFFAALALAILALALECAYEFGVDIVKIFGMTSVPGAMAILDAQFVIYMYLLVIPEVITSFRNLARKRATAELLLTAGLVVVVAYTLAIMFSEALSYPLFGFLYAIFVLSAIGASYLRLAADFTAFKRIAKNGEKLVVDCRPTRTLERENAALDGMIEEYKSKTARVFKTLFVPDFHKRASLGASPSSSILLIIGASLGFALITAAVALFIPGGFANAASAFALVFLLACPAMTLMTGKALFSEASREIDSENSAVIGEGSLERYAGIDVITFEDVEVFGKEDVTLQRIKLFGNNENLSKALRQMSALFMNVGGPLDYLFSNSLDRKCSPATQVTVEKNGISGEVDGHTVLAGTYEYMKKMGVEFANDADSGNESIYDSTKVMFAAEDGFVYAKFYIRYSFSEEFSMLLPALEDNGITPLVYTRDPNVTDELIITLTAGADKIRVLKKCDTNADDGVIYNSVGAGLVTVGDKNNAINSILVAKKYIGLKSRLGMSELISMAVGGVMAAVLSLGGMTLVPTVVLAAWQAGWCIALSVIAKRSFRSGKSE